MVFNTLRLTPKTPLVVGSFCDAAALRAAGSGPVLEACDVAEVRLDLLVAEEVEPSAQLWSHLKGVPLLFTARRKEEGGGLESSLAQRSHWLQTALNEAAAIDLEAAILDEAQDLVSLLHERNIPIVVSFHDFEILPPRSVLESHLEKARSAGATVFKVAAHLAGPDDLATLAEFQREDHGILKAVMGMGPLGVVSRLLCAQYGSVLNYGYIGKKATAPGQWTAAQLKDALRALAPVDA